MPRLTSTFAGRPCPSWIPQPMVPPTHLPPFKLFEVQVIANPTQISVEHKENLLSQPTENPEIGLASGKAYPSGSKSQGSGYLPSLLCTWHAVCSILRLAGLRVEGGRSSAWSLSLVKALGRENISPGCVLRRAGSFFLRRPQPVLPTPARPTWVVCPS